MDLRTGVPVLIEGVTNSEALVGPPLERETRCEVLIIGAGVTGALAAERLVGLGIDTVLVDSRPVGSGSTAASTCLLLQETDTPAFELEERIGAAATRRVLELGGEAIDEIARLCAVLPGGCEFERRKSVYVASRDADVPLLEREWACRARLGLPVERLSQEELRGEGFRIETPLALRTATAGEVNALVMARELVCKAVGQGLRLFGESRIVGEERGRGRSMRLRSEQGPLIVADSVVYATGYEAHEHVNAEIGTLASTWAFASEPVADWNGWPEGTLIWETARPYVYLRTSKDGRVIMGGADEPYVNDHADERKLERKTAELMARFHTLLPTMQIKPATAWAGVFGSSRDGLPYIGPLHEGRRAYYALGYGGNGITFSAIAAGILADLVQGVENEDARLFRFGR